MAFQPLKTYCVKVKGLIAVHGNANESSLQEYQVCLRFVNKAVITKIKSEKLNYSKMAVLMNILLLQAKCDLVYYMALLKILSEQHTAVTHLITALCS